MKRLTTVLILVISFILIGVSGPSYGMVLNVSYQDGPFSPNESGTLTADTLTVTPSDPMDRVRHVRLVSEYPEYAPGELQCPSPPCTTPVGWSVSLRLVPDSNRYQLILEGRSQTGANLYDGTKGDPMALPKIAEERQAHTIRPEQIGSGFTVRLANHTLHLSVQSPDG